MRSSLRSASRAERGRDKQEQRDDASTTAKPPKTKEKGTLLKKISSTLTSRAPRRAIADFQITLDDTHRQYAPGELVTGVVTVVAEKDLKITHLVVNLRGYVELYSGPTNGGIHAGKRKLKDPANLANIQDTTSTLCTDEQVLCGEGKLDAGVYNFQFMMVLPGKGLPSSLDFEKGKIEYKITASLTRPVSVSPIMLCSTTFSVRESIDVAPLRIPALRQLTLDPKKSKEDKASNTDSTQHVALDNSTTYSAIPPTKAASASVELLKAGCLPGGLVPLQIKIQHHKPIKSICGVIITLYRLGSFDTYSLASPAQKAKIANKKVGFSGSSNTAFRKELDQVVLPLMVDPATLSCTLKPTIRVPEDAFPTIASVPLGLVSFKYYIEVVVDLGGKIAHRDELFVPIDSSVQRPPVIADPEDYRPRAPLLSNINWIFETDRIRRVTNVKACKFEVVVGTVDSQTSHGQRHTEPITIPESPLEDLEMSTPTSPEMYIPITAPIEIPPPSHSPPPVHEFPATSPEPLDEKARIRLAEDQLLPSSPPIDLSEQHPSAPPFTLAPPTFLAATGFESPSAPPQLEDVDDYTPSTDDKQELERQRLLEEATSLPSAPPLPIAVEAAPSAPPLPEPSEEVGHLPSYYLNA